MKKSLLTFTSLCLLSFFGNAQGLADGLVHHYQFNGNGNDQSTNLNHLTNFGATPTTNRHGDTSQAYHFTNGQYMSGPLSKLPVGNATRSTSIWLYLDIDPDSDVPFCWGTTNTSAGYGVAIGTNVGFTNGIRHFGWGNDIGFSYKYPVKEWFHLVTIYDGDTGKVYINAQLVSTEAKKWNTGSELFLVGKNLNANPRDGFEGAIDEFRVYDRVLTENQIVALWHSDNTSVANTHLSNARVYPNPTTGKLYIEDMEASEVEVVDVLGQTVGTYTATQSLDLSTYTNGIYYIRIKDKQTGITAQKKILKMD